MFSNKFISDVINHSIDISKSYTFNQLLIIWMFNTYNSSPLNRLVLDNLLQHKPYGMFMNVKAMFGISTHGVINRFDSFTTRCKHYNIDYVDLITKLLTIHKNYKFKSFGGKINSIELIDIINVNNIYNYVFKINSQYVIKFDVVNYCNTNKSLFIDDDSYRLYFGRKYLVYSIKHQRIFDTFIQFKFTDELVLERPISQLGHYIVCDITDQYDVAHYKKLFETNPNLMDKLLINYRIKKI